MPTSKEARSNREALKKAGRQERIPNLLLARLERQQARRTAGPIWPIWVIFILLFGLLAFILHRNFKNGPILPVPLGLPVASSGVNAVPSTSTQTIASPVAPSPAEPTANPVAAVPQQPAAVSQPTPAAAPVTPAAPPPETAAPRYTQWKGFYSPIKKYREVIIDSDSAWADLWKEMGQTGPAPAIHFQDSSVVGIFQGDSPPGSDVVLTNLHEYRRHMTIYYRLTSGSSGASNATQPFHLKVIPRTDKPIRFLQMTEAPAALTPATTTQP